MNLIKILNEGTTIYTSGTTGPSKPIHQPVAKIKSANKVARDVQMITKDSKVYTVCSMDHAGGLFAQTLPAIEVKAQVYMESFNPYSWIKKIKDFSNLFQDHGGFLDRFDSIFFPILFLSIYVN